MKRWIKVCGLRSRTHVDDAVRAGATHCGFNTLAISKRRVSLDTALDLTRQIRRDQLPIEPVVLLDHPDLATVNQLIGAGAAFVQLHGGESIDQLAIYPKPFIMAVVRKSDRLESALARVSTCRHLLIDSTRDELPSDWVDRLRRAAGKIGTKLWRAGGLAPEQVPADIQSFDGVDVASGIEVDAVPDFQRMRSFVEAFQR